MALCSLADYAEYVAARQEIAGEYRAFLVLPLSKFHIIVDARYRGS